MTLNEIRSELVYKTERKIQEMKARSIILPERRADLCELCDMLSQEIYDFAVNTTIQIADRNHLRRPVPSLLEELHDDICALTNGALDIIVSASDMYGSDKGSPIRIAQPRRSVFSVYSLARISGHFQSFFSKFRRRQEIGQATCC